MTRPELIPLGPVKMVGGKIPLVRLQDLSPAEHCTQVGQAVDGFRYSEIGETETRARLKSLGFTDASVTRVIEFANRRKLARVTA